jgi:hypothetical protein
MKPIKRLSVTLTEAQGRVLAEFNRPGPYREELVAWARRHGHEIGDSPSEATLIRVLIDAGIEHVHTRSMDVVYTELAGIYVEEGLSHEIAAMRSETLGDGHQSEADGSAAGH